jgi:transcriptional regulator with XRE-family HTH domain
MSAKKPVVGLGAEIRKLREAKGFSQRHLGELVAMPESAIARLEKSPSLRPRIDTLQRLAGALGVTVAELVKDVPVIVAEPEAG